MKHTLRVLHALDLAAGELSLSLSLSLSGLVNIQAEEKIIQADDERYKRC
jgi:hypothetical protein